MDNTMDPQTTPKVSRSKLKQHLVEWERIGSKWPGTNGEKQAKDYIYDQLQKYEAIDTRLEEFDYCQCTPISAAVRTTSPTKTEVSCVPVANYPNGSVEGELVYVGSGSRTEFERLQENGMSFRNKIILATTDAPFLVTPLAEEFGAIGLLTITDARLSGLSELSRRCTGAFYHTTAEATEMLEHPSNFPTDLIGAMVPMSEGHRLLSLLSAEKVHVAIENKANFSVETSANLIGRIEGTENPEETVVMGGHYDTEITVPGVWDNGTGVASVLELARSFAIHKSRPKRTMEFVFFGCEETGCWGSVNYAQDHKEALSKRGSAMLNFDGLGGKTTAKHTIWASEDLSDLAIKAADEVGWVIDDIGGLELTVSDHAPFRDIGVSTAWIGDSAHLPPYYHTPQDTLRFVDMDDLVETLQVAKLCVRRVVGDHRV